MIVTSAHYSLFSKTTGLFFRMVLLSFFLLGLQPANAQVFSEKENKIAARENIELLRDGSLIVPLFRQNTKMEKIDQLIQQENLSEKARERLIERKKKDLDIQNEFNKALIRHFTQEFNFTRVYFVEDHQLHQGDPETMQFINPQTMQPDTDIQFEGDNFFLLRYFKASGIATDPRDVRYFYIADRDWELLKKPFPSSPDRKTIYRLRFRDLLNISPDTNELIHTLVIKLNANLLRYFEG